MKTPKKWIGIGMIALAGTVFPVQASAEPADTVCDGPRQLRNQEQMQQRRELRMQKRVQRQTGACAPQQRQARQAVRQARRGERQQNRRGQL